MKDRVPYLNIFRKSLRTAHLKSCFYVCLCLVTLFFMQPLSAFSQQEYKGKRTKMIQRMTMNCMDEFYNLVIATCLDVESFNALLTSIEAKRLTPAYVLKPDFGKFPNDANLSGLDHYLLAFSKTYSAYLQNAGSNPEALTVELSQPVFHSIRHVKDNLYGLEIVFSYTVSIQSYHKPLYEGRSNGVVRFDDMENLEGSYIRQIIPELDVTESVQPTTHVAEPAVQSTASSSQNYDFIGDYSKSGLAVVRKDGKYGFIDKQGRVVVPVKYNQVGCEFSILWRLGSSDDVVWDYPVLMSASLNGKWGFVNRKGEMVVPAIYDRVDSNSHIDNTPFWVQKDNIYGCIDTLGNVIIPFQYSEKIDFYVYGTKAARTKRDGKWGMINQKGDIVVPFIYDGIRAFSKVGSVRLVMVHSGGKYGYVNFFGNVAIPLVYEFASDFSDGLAAVVKNGSVGYINSDGMEVIPPQYEPYFSFDSFGDILHYCYKFRSGVAMVRKNGKFALINKKGENITDFIYDDITMANSSGRFCAVKDGVEIYVDRYGKEFATESEMNAQSSPMPRRW